MVRSGAGAAASANGGVRDVCRWRVRTRPSAAGRLHSGRRGAEPGTGHGDSSRAHGSQRPRVGHEAARQRDAPADTHVTGASVTSAGDPTTTHRDTHNFRRTTSEPGAGIEYRQLTGRRGARAPFQLLQDAEKRRAWERAERGE